MKKNDEPEKITLTAEESEALKERILANNLSEEDRSLLVGLVSCVLWLQLQLSRAKLSIHRLKQLFGFSTEKKSLQEK